MEYFKYRPKRKVQAPSFEKISYYCAEYVCIYIKTTGNNPNYDRISYIQLLNSDGVFLETNGVKFQEMVRLEGNNANGSKNSYNRKNAASKAENADSIISVLQGRKMVVYNSVFCYPFLYNELKSIGFIADTQLIDLKNDNYINFSSLCESLDIESNITVKAMEMVYKRLYG